MSIKINILNLINSIPFYRALTGNMPNEIGYDFMKFSFGDDQLHLIESSETNFTNDLVLAVPNHEIALTYHRMRFFRKETEMGQNCEVLTTSFSIKDTDGNPWLIVADSHAHLVRIGHDITCKLLPINSILN